MTSASTVLPVVIQQHVEEAALLWQLRTDGTKRANFALMYLDRFDRRLEAHLDGIAVAGRDAWRFCEAALENPSAGAVFTAAERAIQQRDHGHIENLFALAQAVPEARRGLLSAFGWLGRPHLQGIAVQLITSDEPFRCMVGLAVCAMHRVDPRASLRTNARTDQQPRARFLRAAGELGLVDLTPDVVSALKDEHPECQFWASWSAVLLGSRSRALDVLQQIAAVRGPHRDRAFQLALQAMSGSAGRELLKRFAQDTSNDRWLIKGSGVLGEPAHLPWLIERMRTDAVAQLAGESFTLISGLDLALMDLERKPPEDFESGPNDDPADPNVAMDPDEGLPWPDPDKIEKWWAANASKFQKGKRYFMGAPVTREHCINVLKTGYQRQRILAAHYLCLLDPGTPLFNTSAPAWRQQRLLARM